jgi:anti-anti-sigma regulatory factor
MKLGCETTPDGLTVRIRGDVEGASCNCLEHFWDHYVEPAPDRLVVEMSETSDLDGVGTATIVNLLRRALEGGSRIILDSPPQMLAHTLYKIAMLERIEIMHPRVEEPYGD